MFMTSAFLIRSYLRVSATFDYLKKYYEAKWIDP